MRLFLDANVLFTAAHRPGGKAGFVLELAAGGFWKVVTSGFAIEEARRNLEVKFPHAVDGLDDLLTGVGLVPTIIDMACPIDLAAKDEPIFLSARGARCSHLLTGDVKHFGPYMNAPDRTSGILIQTVAEFLAELG